MLLLDGDGLPVVFICSDNAAAFIRGECCYRQPWVPGKHGGPDRPATPKQYRAWLRHHGLTKLSRPAVHALTADAAEWVPSTGRLKADEA